MTGSPSPATTIAAHSVGFVQSGGNTFVYVNTSNAAETLSTSTDMKIELQGNVNLTATNFVL